MLGTTAAIHLRLYTHDGYSSIPGKPSILKVGHLFILNGVGGSVLCLAVLATPLLLRWVAAAGAAFELGTLAGLMISIRHGLFGFRDSSHAPFYHEAIVVELIGLAALLALAMLPTKREAAA